MILLRFIKTKKKEGLSNKTINNILTTIGTIFNWAIENGYTNYNPAQRVKKLKVENCSLGQGENPETIYRKNICDWNFVNYFTVPVAREFAPVADALKKLKNSGALFADMSGSGSTVFGVFVNADDALKAKKLLEGDYVTVLS